MWYRGRVARLRLRDQPLVETFQFGSPLAISARVDVDIYWVRTGKPILRGEGTAVEPISAAAFLGEFAEARSFGWASAIETGFSFETGRLTADQYFAEMGPERNGVFLS